MSTESPISQFIADLSGVIEATRAQIVGIDAKIEELDAERQRIKLAPPHSSDIVGTFRRGLSASAAEFERHVATNLSERFVAPDDAAVAATRAAHLLTIEERKPDRETMQTRSMTGQGPALSMAALTYFLRDRIEEELPGLVERLCPAAQQGMRQADRDAALTRIASEIAALRATRDAMHADLNAARRATGSR